MFGGWGLAVGRRSALSAQHPAAVSVGCFQLVGMATSHVGATTLFKLQEVDSPSYIIVDSASGGWAMVQRS